MSRISRGRLYFLAIVLLVLLTTVWLVVPYLLDIALVFVLALITYKVLSGKLEWEGVHSAKDSELTPRRFAPVSVCVFCLILFAISAFLFEGRTLSFWLLITGISVALIMSSVCYSFNQRQELIILILIIGFALLLRGSVYYQFDGLVGVDPWFHRSFSEDIINTGHVPSRGSYEFFPIFHISVATITQTLSVDLKTSMFFAGAFVETVSLLFIYLMVKRYLSRRYSLLACLLVAIAPWHMKWGFWLIPMTMVIASFPLVLLLLARRNREDRTTFIRGLAIALLMVAVLIHPVGSFILVFSFGVVFIANRLRRFAGPEASRNVILVSAAMLLLSAVSLFSYWTYAGGSLVSALRVLLYGLTIDRPIALESIGQARTITEVLFDRIPFYGFGFLGLLGLLFSWKLRDRKAGVLQLSFVSVSIGLMAVGGMVLNARELLPERWLPFLVVAMSAPMALAALTLWGWGKRKGVLSVLFVIGITFLTLSSVLNYQSRVSSEFPWESGPRAALLVSEMSVARFIQEKSVSPIHSDTYYAIYFREFLREDSLDASDILRNHTQFDGLLLVRVSILGTTSWLRVGDSIGSWFYDYELGSRFDVADNRIADWGTVVVYKS